MKKRIIIATLIAIFASVANAQETISGNDLRERYLQAYEELDYCMKQMSDASIEARAKYMSRARRLFYDSYIYDSSDITVHIVSNRKVILKTLMRFFSDLEKGIHGSSKFTITNVSVPNFPANINVSDLRQVNDSIFSLVASVPQTFTGYKDGLATYTDVTTKKMNVYLLRKTVNKKKVFTPLLTGDIYVVEKKAL